MERKIGETFEYKGKIFKVTEAKGDICIGCFFNGRCFASDIAGECKSEYRSDKKEVIFVEIQEQPQEQAEQPKLNLCEILKHCPKGEMFWSPLLGDVKLYGTDQETEKVVVTAVCNVNWSINADGTIPIESFTSPEIMLYPSREQRDWTKVKYEPKKERFDPKTLKAFDKVLVRFDCGAWSATLFSHLIDSKFANKKYDIICCGSVFGYCIPYNDETKHLLGTKEEAPEFYKYWED